MNSKLVGSYNSNIGFTLVEVMVVVAIVGILAAVAWPNYQNTTCKSYRKTAQADLMSLGAKMERFYTTNNFTYAGATISATGAAATDVGLNYSPEDGSSANRKYGISIASQSASAYTLKATPVAASDCAVVMELSSSGARGQDGNNDGDTDDAGEDSWN